MNPKLLLKVFPVVLLTIAQIVGMGGVARSEATGTTAAPLAPQVEAVKESIPDLIKLLKHPDERVRSSAAAALKKLGYQL